MSVSWLFLGVGLENEVTCATYSCIHAIRLPQFSSDRYHLPPSSPERFFCSVVCRSESGGGRREGENPQRRSGLLLAVFEGDDDGLLLLCTKVGGRFLPPTRKEKKGGPRCKSNTWHECCTYGAKVSRTWMCVDEGTDVLFIAPQNPLPLIQRGGSENALIANGVVKAGGREEEGELIHF